MKSFASMLVALGLFSGSSAYAMTVDFNDQKTGEVASPFETDGLRFTASASPSGITTLLAIANQPGVGTSPYLTWCLDCTMTIETISGQVFDLQSADIANGAFVADMVLTGFRDDGTTVTQTFLFDTSLSNYTFDKGWTNLTSVQFTTTAIPPESVGQAIDNIMIQVVPLPGAAWLFLSAIAALGLRSRIFTT